MKKKKNANNDDKTAPPTLTRRPSYIWENSNQKLLQESKRASPPELNLSDTPDSKVINDFLDNNDEEAFSLNSDELNQIRTHLRAQYYEKNEEIFGHEAESDRVYLVVSGSVSLYIREHFLTRFTRCMSFGEIGFLENRRRRGRIIASEKTILLVLKRSSLESDEFPPKIGMKIMSYMGKRLASLLQGYDLYREMDVLVVQDGGCSPGYNAAVSFLCEYFEKVGRRVFAANTGFKSVVSGNNDDFSFLIHDNDLYRYLSLVPNSCHSPTLRLSRGAAFRTERYPAFKEDENQEKAVANIIARGVKILVCVGGNGTFLGARALANRLPANVLTYFIPATIDSDVIGTECLGESTGVEMGSEKLRCYLADASTHHRAYLVEMMGREGGYHCLHSSLGAGADLAVLPGSELDLSGLAQYITNNQHTVVAIAEGYQREEREKKKFKGNAAEYLKLRLQETGKLDEEKKRVICEPFSRDIRGCTPNNLDILLAQVMAREVVGHALEKRGQLMPTKNGENVSYLEFDEIDTDNAVDAHFAELSNRIHMSITAPLASLVTNK